ncbi:hypothetical protein FHT40_006035 [Mycolicibacterium sp. BK556]|uniref:hypothetical protein n=1 Tax=unclassified Mycolicibacterium TaxID=2636767 RepID=UPI00160B2D89|nr:MULTISPECIES: hypothetical protein [unclassified Mycolicibacterium]MBB3606344.1 hypothetical protein [Mycolicibacterium sp. BK556]MBB3636410.1 hypothetical protein [Mycolicibacterium sp. BK607]
MNTPQQPAEPSVRAPQPQPTWPNTASPQHPPIRPNTAVPHQQPMWPNIPAPQQYPVTGAHPRNPYAAAPYPAALLYQPSGEPIFTVRLRKHTGLGLAWLSQTYSVTGTFHQCEAAIKDAQRHNLAAGWWSIASIVLWNWIALGENTSARKALRRNASHYGYVPVPR